MTTLNVHEAKTHLSRYLEKVEAGETIILCRHNKPIAELRPIASKVSRTKRKFGIDEGKFEVGPAFFESLPDEMQGHFDGASDD